MALFMSFTDIMKGCIRLLTFVLGWRWHTSIGGWNLVLLPEFVIGL